MQQLTGLLSANHNCLARELNIHGDTPKVFYRMFKLKDKRGKANFLKSVRHCIYHDILTTELVRNYSADVRWCIKSYHFLHASKWNTVKNKLQSSCLELLPQETEKMAKTYNTQRCFGYSHYGYCTEGPKVSFI